MTDPHDDTSAAAGWRTSRLIESSPGALCGWAKVDRYGEMYPCDNPSWRRLVDAPEEWEGDYCKYHSPRARNRATALRRQYEAEVF